MFADKDQFDIVDLVRELIKVRKEGDISDSEDLHCKELISVSQDYYKLRALFDDIDLEKDNPQLLDQLEAITCKNIFS